MAVEINPSRAQAAAMVDDDEVSGEPVKAAQVTERCERVRRPEHFAGEHAKAPSVGGLQELYVSPATELALWYADLPRQRLERQVSCGLSSVFRGAESAYMETMRSLLESYTALTEMLNVTDPVAINPSKFVSLGGLGLSICPDVSAASYSPQPIQIDLPSVSVVNEAQRRIEEALNSVGSIGTALKQFEERQRTIANTPLNSFVDRFGDVTRTAQWMSTLGQIDTPELTKLLGSGLGMAVDNIRATIFSHSPVGSDALDQVKMSEMLGSTTRLDLNLTATRLKMSAFAGIGEVYDRHSHLQLEAYHSLLGEWRTRADLPEKFWRDERVRECMYREADVDEGLIVAEAGTALEIMIDSGLAAGLRSEGNAVAVVTLGEVSMTVKSRDTSKDAYALVGQFEQTLRVYVERKLKARFGPNWFKLRASNLIGKAKSIREMAMARGEAFASLVNFTELGELSSIIQSTPNWDGVFGDVFARKTEFDHDLQKLIAIRRPTMHMRRIDSVRLVEAFCVIQRLSMQMDADGSWQAQAAIDH